ncbi:MAG: DUF3592 domain-containing protein [Thermoplasmata archaeon]
MDDLGLGYGRRPTVGQMLMRDVFVYMFLSTPFILLLTILILSAMADADATSLTYMYGVLVLDVAACFVVIYWRRSMYSSVLNSGVEVEGKVVSVRKSGDALVVEYEYRWQAETMRSTRRVSGYLPKTRVREEVGTTATLLVDPSKPTRFLVLDSVR